MDITTIPLNSAAGRALSDIMANPLTHTVRLSHDGDPTTLKLKANGGMWSPPLELAETPTCHREHGDWTGPHQRISSCP